MKIEKYGKKHYIQILYVIVSACGLSHTQGRVKDTPKGQRAPLEFSSHQAKLANCRKTQEAMRLWEFIYATEQQALPTFMFPSQLLFLSVAEEVGAST